MAQLSWLLSVIGILVVSIRSVDAATASITVLPAYASQRSCAKECFHVANDGPDVIADTFSCSNPVDNTCFCRADLQDPINAYLSSCVSHWCDGATVDMSSATSIYNSYCTAAGYLKDGTTPTTTAPAITTTGGGAQTGATSQIANPTTTSDGSTTTENGNASTGSNGSTSYGGLSFAELIGVIVGGLGFIASAIGAWYTYKMFVKKKRPHGEGDRGLARNHYPQQYKGYYQQQHQQQHQQQQYYMGPVASAHAIERNYGSPPPQYSAYPTR